MTAAIEPLPGIPGWIRGFVQLGDDTRLSASRQDVLQYQSSGYFTETAYILRNLETAEEVHDLDFRGSGKLVVQMLLHPLEVTVKTNMLPQRPKSGPYRRGDTADSKPVPGIQVGNR
jgi:hypothetical protein